jgi:hypothetical protein
MLLVVREGSQAPGTPAGTVFFGFPTIGTATPPTFNAAGAVAFTTLLRGDDVTASNDRGLWAQDDNGVLNLVLRKGDLFEVAAGDFRTISFISAIIAGGDEGGRSTFFNADGTLAFRLDFTDGTSGIFTAAVPEPSTFALLAIGAVGICLHRTRRRVN